MDEALLVATITDHARSIFNQPSLSYSRDLVFQEILGFDSVQAVQFILAMEASLGVTINEDEVDRMYTMGDLLEILRTKLAASAG